MRLSVIGCGYLGAVHAAAMVALGHEVVGVDTDLSRVATLGSARAPFYEPGLNELLRRGIESGRLKFTTDIAEASNAEIHFIAVGTPQSADAEAVDLTFVDRAIEALLPHLTPGAIIAGKSTVPVGTAARLAKRVKGAGAAVVWNPEFLREGHAVHDTLQPDRIVVGGQDAAACQRLVSVYWEALENDTPVVVTDSATAELIKLAANAFLATKISFINAMSQLSDATGADVTVLADAIGLDPRIGRAFLGAGIGFGGGCLPKDIRGLSARAREVEQPAIASLLGAVDSINQDVRRRMFELVRAHADDSGPVAVLGLTFKPNSDDLRDSPALEIARSLQASGVDVLAYDPAGMSNAKAVAPELSYVASIHHAVRVANVIVVATEWEQFRQFDPPLRVDGVVIDARNCLSRERWTAAGWTFVAPGRGVSQPDHVSSLVEEA